jgi:hypothetical protein
MFNTNIAAELMGLTPAAARQFVKTVASSATPERLTQRAVSSLAVVVATRVVTVTTGVAHEFIVGDQVTISGANETEYNKTFTIETVPSTTTFTFTMPARETAYANGTGTIVAVGEIWFRAATFLGRNAVRTPNTGNVWIGPNSANDTQPFVIGSDGEVGLPAPTGTRLNAAQWYIDVATNADGAVILFF